MSQAPRDHTDFFELLMDGDGVVDGVTDLHLGKWYGDWDENTRIFILYGIERWWWSEQSTENGRERSYDEEVIAACFLLWRHPDCVVASSSVLQMNPFLSSFSHAHHELHEHLLFQRLPLQVIRRRLRWWKRLHFENENKNRMNPPNRRQHTYY